MSYDIDYETKSAEDISTVGAYTYAKHPSTRIILAAVKKGNGPTLLWDVHASPEQNAPALALLQEAFASGEVWAHNAGFEFAITHYRAKADLGIDPPPTSSWRCSEVLCRIATIPGSLANATKEMGGKMKDSAGKDLIQIFCCDDAVDPFAQTSVTWEDHRLTKAQPLLPAALYANAQSITIASLTQYFPKAGVARLEKVLSMIREYSTQRIMDVAGAKVNGEVVPYPKAWEMFRNYCVNDVDAQYDLRHRLADFIPPQWIWDSFHADLEINLRGVPIDRSAVETAIRVLADNETDLVDKFGELTGGLSPTQGAKFLLWAKERGYTGQDLQAQTVEELLNVLPEDTDLYKALYTRHLISYAALKKLPTMLAMSEVDGRASGCMRFWGASRTGRDAGVLLQIQNFKRPEKGIDTPLVVDFLRAGCGIGAFVGHGMLDPAFSNPHRAIASSIRHFLREPNARTVSCDFANIESRASAWIVGQEDRLARYAAGEDIYMFNAASIFDENIDDLMARLKDGDPAVKAMRSVGKVQELACGYRGGESAVETFAKVYRVTLTAEQKRKIVTSFRRDNPFYVEAWNELERCAREAIITKESRQHRRIGFSLRRLAGDEYLCMHLPSNRCLYYKRPRVRWFRLRFQGGKKTSTTELGGQPSPEEIKRLTRLTEEERRTVDRERAASKDPENYRPSIYYMVKPQVSFWGNTTGNNWGWDYTHGGVLLENATQATAGCFLHYAVPRLVKAGFPITMKIHDEVVGPETSRLSLTRIEEIMSERPPWASDFPLKAVASVSDYYTKD